MTDMPGRRSLGAALVIAGGLAGVGLILIREAYLIPNKAGYAGIGSGDVPFLIGLCLIGLAAWTAIGGVRGDFAAAPPQRAMPVIWIVGGLIVQLSILHAAGFVLASGLLFAATAAGFGERRLYITVPAGLVLAAIVYGVFDGLLDLNLPGGPFERAVFGG